VGEAGKAAEFGKAARYAASGGCESATTSVDVRLRE